MNNYIQPGETIELTAPAGGVVAGSVYKIGQLLVVAAVTADAGAKFNGQTAGVFKVVKETGAAWTEGALVYWDDTAKDFNLTATGNQLAGVATKAAASGDVVGYVRLNGIGAVDS